MSLVRSFFRVPKLSFSRLAILLAPMLIAAAWIGYSYATAESRLYSIEPTLAKLGLGAPTKNRLDSRFRDADRDLVADPPKDPAKFIDPAVLKFASIPNEDELRSSEVWMDFVKAIGTATGKKVEQLEFSGMDEQLAAFERGDLHVAVFNTGAVPSAVNTCGFVPLCTFGRADRTYGYKMQIIVPASSSLHAVEDIRGCKFAFTDRNSNSGFKLPLVLLKDEFNLLPDRDYNWRFTFSHETSIGGVAARDYDAAAVASDVLEREFNEDNQLRRRIRVIYESERFPPAALGVAWNLSPQLSAKLRAAILEFKMPGTSLDQEFKRSGVTQFVPISYKDDWALMRRIDNELGRTRRPRPTVSLP